MASYTHPERVPAGWPRSLSHPTTNSTPNLGRRGYHARRPFTPMKRIKQKALRPVLLESTSDPDCGVIFSSIDLWQGKESVCLSTYEGPLGESLLEARKRHLKRPLAAAVEAETCEKINSETK